LKIAACHSCHTQYDVSSSPTESFECRCGEQVEVQIEAAADALVRRCSACGALASENDDACDYCGSEIVHIGDRGSLICPECFARNADDGRFCLACGVAFSPEPVPVEKSDVRCPCCECWMGSRQVGGLEIHECPKCHGLWAPENRFDALVDRAVSAARERAARGEQPPPRVDGGNPTTSGVEYRRCPCCDALMARRNFQKRSGVVIDRCHAHGTWLDAHELEQIAGFVLSGRAETATRLESAQREAEQAAAARDAYRRVVLPADSTTDPTFTFSSRDRSDGSVVGTIFDFLIAVLR